MQVPVAFCGSRGILAGLCWKFSLRFLGSMSAGFSETKVEMADAFPYKSKNQSTEKGGKAEGEGLKEREQSQKKKPAREIKKKQQSSRRKIHSAFLEINK